MSNAVNNQSGPNYYNPMPRLGQLYQTMALCFSQEGILGCERVASVVTTPLTYLATALTHTLQVTLDMIIEDKDLAKLKPKASDFPHLTDEELNDLWQKRMTLFSLVKKQDGFYLWKNQRIERILQDPKILDRLEVELPLSEIKEIFKNYEIIVLRKPKEEKLLFYCGNRPIYSSAMRWEYPKGERKGHHHSDSDTIDCDILMNPTIAGDTGRDAKGLRKYFESISHTYREIEGEHMSVITTQNEPDETLFFLDGICAENGSVKNAYSNLATATEKIEKVIRVAQLHNFEVTASNQVEETWTPEGNYEHEYTRVSFMKR